MVEVSNSEATKARIATLRRDRQAAKGRAERAAIAALDLRIKASREWGNYRDLADQIKALGGKVRNL